MTKSSWVSTVLRVEKPWGHEEHFALVDGRYCGKALYVNGGHSLSLQYHEQKEETVAVQSGRLLFEVGDPDTPLESFELLPGEAVHLRPGTRHRMTALEDTVILEAPLSSMTLYVSKIVTAALRRAVLYGTSVACRVAQKGNQIWPTCTCTRSDERTPPRSEDPQAWGSPGQLSPLCHHNSFRPLPAGSNWSRGPHFSTVAITHAAAMRCREGHTDGGQPGGFELTR